MMYDELIRWLRSQCQGYGKICEDCGANGNCRSQMANEAADAIEELSHDLDIVNEANIALHGALPMWIPVTERLPKEAGSYLVAVHQDDSENAEGYSLVLDAWYNPKTYPFTTVGWTLLNEWYDLTPRLREEITHWMPLPEPPKEEI